MTIYLRFEDASGNPIPSGAARLYFEPSSTMPMIHQQALAYAREYNRRELHEVKFAGYSFWLMGRERDYRTSLLPVKFNSEELAHV